MIKENTPTICTERLVLRRFALGDVQALYELLSDRDTNVFLPWLPLKSLEEAREFLQTQFLDSYQASSGYRYAICLKEIGRPVGYVWLSTGESCDFGYCLSKELWHRGIVSEAAQAVVQRIKNAGYDYITATHDILNPRSGNIMKKLGMEYKYSYNEVVQPKNIQVTFRMFQLNFDGNAQRVYQQYWNKYGGFVESL